MVSTNLISTKFIKILLLSFFIPLIVHMLLCIYPFLVGIEVHPDNCLYFWVSSRAYKLAPLTHWKPLS